MDVDLPDLDPREAHRVLTQLGARKLAPIPAEVLSAHILGAYEGAGWPIQRAAFEALLRRSDHARRDELRIAKRPPRGRTFGEYRTKSGRRRGAARPWRTVVRSLDPLDASCDCPDFRRGGLGICKHVLVALSDMCAKPRKRERALAAGASEADDAVRLEWDPIRPLTGEGHWMDRLRLTLGKSKKHFLLRSFRSEGGALVPRAKTDVERAALVQELRRWLAHNPGAAPPALEALLEEEHAERERLRGAERSARAARPALRTLRRPLYPYQREGVERFLKAGRLLLADDMGLGKTVQATAACHALYASKSVKRGLLVVPASLKGQWQREWESFTDAPLTPVEGTPAERARRYEETERGFLILNYELLLRDLKAVLAWDPDLVVLDEAQRIKNWATKTASCVKRLRPRHRLVLTGTPFENRLEELASVMDWIDDRALQPKWRLVPVHMDAGGARHLDTLRARLAPSMLRRRRPEILRQLPERTDTVVPVELTDAQRDAHDELNRPIAILVQTAKRRPLSPAQFLRLMTLLATQRVIANGIAQLEFEHHWPDLEGKRPDAARLAALSSPKLGELREIVRSLVIEQGRKVVVFSQWRRMLALAHWAIGDLLEDAGHKAVFFTGRESPKQRTRSVVELHDDPATTVLFSTDAGGVGLNLQRAATCCINLELPWNPAVLEQRIARIHRLGQKHPIDVVNLVSLDCIESHIADLVADKKALFDGLFDGVRDSVDFDRATGLVGRLERVLDPALLEAAAGLEEDEDASDAAIDGLVAAADEARDGDLAATAAPPTASVSDLLSRIRIEPRSDGGLRIEAPPEAAEGLRALFEGMARLMAQAGAAP